MKRYLTLLFIVLCAWIAQAAPPWTGIVASSRAIDWSKAGLALSFADGEVPSNPWTPPPRSTICTTLTTASFPGMTVSTPVAPTALINAIQSCPNDEVVRLSAGSYYFNASVEEYCTGAAPCAINSISVRGDGGDQTFVYMSNNASWNIGSSNAQFTHFATLSAAPSVGSTSLTSSASLGLANGTLIGITQCSTSASGTVNSSSGYSCTATNGNSIYDNGGEFRCTNDGPFCSHGSTTAVTPTPATDEAGNPTGAQLQLVATTADVGTAITTALPIILDDLNTANTPGVFYTAPTLQGVGLEDMSIDFSSGTTGILSMFDCYECWIKGLRIIGNSNTGGSNASPVVIDDSANFLFANNYLFAYNSGGYGVITGNSYGASYGLLINNVGDRILGMASDISTSGNVVAYNYSLPPANENYFQHEGGTTFDLWEGNDFFDLLLDSIHGTHDLETVFRNRIRGISGSTYSGAVGEPPITAGQGVRFVNVVGNVLGDGSQTGYINASGNIYAFGGVYMTGGLVGSLVDPTVQDTIMLWGNYDTFNATSRFNSAEVPSALTTWSGFQQSIGTGNGSTTAFSGTLTNCSVSLPCINVILGDMKDSYFSYDIGTGSFYVNGMQNGGVTTPLVQSAGKYGSINYTTGAISATYVTAPTTGAAIFANYLQPTVTASPYQNAVPGNNNLPPSFFLPITQAYPSGGTGLSWWKVCTNYPACSTSSTPPFPAIGPDVTGGNGPAGHSYAIPAEIAYQNLPVDSTYNSTVSIGSASWASGVATIVTTSVPTLANSGEYHYLAGQFNLSGITPSGYNGTFYVATSNCTTTCTITYALASNPGTYSSGGTFTWPLVRQFNETVYQNDPAGGGGGTPYAPGNPLLLAKYRH